jgi:hypothetical protein
MTLSNFTFDRTAGSRSEVLRGSMKSRLLSLLLALTAAGCSIPTSTMPITAQSGTPVPASRIYRTELTVPSPGHTAKISFLRDAGVLGSACTHKILVDGKAVFAIRAGEFQTLYLAPGQYVFALEIEGGVCPKFSTSQATVLSDGMDDTYRILIPSPTSRPRVARIGASTEGSRGASAEPPFTWDSAYSTPGTSLALREKGRVKSPSGTQVEYELSAVGFSAQESSAVWWKRGTSYSELPATIGENGTVRVRGMQSLMIEDYVPGQAVDVALASGNNRAHAKTIPFPIAAKEGGYWASVEVMSDVGMLFQITFGGFQPAEKVETTSQYRDARSVRTVEASGTGEVVFPVLFGRADRGTATAIATGSRGAVSIQYKVGRDALVRQ